jgi:hypothetical protein
MTVIDIALRRGEKWGPEGVREVVVNLIWLHCIQIQKYYNETPLYN